ncbi:hypothetical protein Sango_3098700, partial [Sesamum angolense]
MKLLVWNYQGLGSLWIVRVLNKLIRLYNPALVFLSETKCKKQKCKQLKERPWLCARDFNEILCQFEKIGASSPGIKSKSSDPAFLIVSLLIWVNWAISTHGAIITRHLIHSSPGSDHNPLLINLEAGKGPRHRQHQKIFRFGAMWTQSEECEDIVKDNWCGEVEGDAGCRILWRTRRVREELIRWDKERFGHVRRHVRQLEVKLEAYAKDPTSASDNSKRRALRGKLDEFLTRKEILWNARKKKNFITKLRNKDESIDEILRGMPRSVNEEMNEALIQPFSPKEPAFIPGRLITDNVLIAYELNHYLAHKTWGSGHAALKLDLSKAYDCVEWSFL